MASEQLVRQWLLLQELSSTRRGRSLDELARAAEVSPRTVRRDLADLASAGFGVETVRTDAGARFRFAEGPALPRVPIDLEEALALHQAAFSAPFFENPVLHRPLEAAVRKIRAAFPPRVAEYLGRVETALTHRRSGPRDPEAARTLRVLAEQAADRCRVAFSYRSLRGEDTRRTADPYCLRHHAGELYLLAHCHLRRAPRVFHLGRIRDCEPLDEEFRVPAGFDPEGLLRKSLGIYLGEPGHAVVRFEGTAARYVAERPLHPEQVVLEETGDRLVLRVPVQGRDEITHEVLKFGSRAEVLGPPELREHVRAEVERLAGRYRQGTKGE